MTQGPNFRSFSSTSSTFTSLLPTIGSKPITHLNLTSNKARAMAICETNYGLIRKATGVAAFERIPIPTVPDDYLLIRVVAVAVNPTDWTTLDAPGDNGTLVGCDWAGLVEEIGPKVEKPFKRGDRVAGFAHGGKSSLCKRRYLRF